MQMWARLALMVTAFAFAAMCGAEDFADSPVFVLDAREAALEPLVEGVPYTAVSAFDDGLAEGLRDLNGNGYPDAFEDSNANGVPDAFEAEDGEGRYVAFLDANENGYPDWFEARYPDLSAVAGSMSAPSTLAIGQAFVLSYGAQNRGPGMVSGQTWTDRVYLSTDNRLDEADVLLGSAGMSVGLTAPQSYSGQISVTVPPVTDGSYYLIVSVDDGRDVLDPDRLNNGDSTAVSVSLPVLEPGTSSSIAYDSGAFTHYYRLDAQAGANPVVSILPQDLPGLTVSARLGALPTSDAWDYQTRDNVLVIPAETDGIWYIQVHGAYLTQAGAYTVDLGTVPMALLEASPNRIGIGAVSRFVLLGAGFAGAMGVDLVNAEGVAYPAGSVTVASYTRMTAEFGADALPEGRYTVRVTDGEGTSSELANAVEVLPYITAEAGSLSEDTAWGGWVRVQGTVTIPAGRTLEIQPGAVIEFAGSAGLTVAGVLDAQGTAEAPVRFTSAADLDPEQNPGPGDWPGLTVRGTGQLFLNDFEICYAGTAINADYEGARVSLFNGIIRDNSAHGIYVYDPYVETWGENLLLANNGYTAIFIRADSRHVYRNCTLVGNGFSGSSGRNAAAIHHGASNLTFDNCIVAFNRNGIDHSGEEPSVTIRNSLFYNPSGSNYVNPRPSEADIFERDGNIVVDPLFFFY